MSTDFDIYLIPGAEPLPDTVTGLGWRIAIYPPTPVDHEDMRRELLEAVGPRSHVMNLHLEGLPTDTAHQRLSELLDQLVLYHNALVHDLQTDVVTSQRGVRPLAAAVPAPRQTRAAPLVMEWIYRGAAPGRAALRARILDVIEATAPKAMPRRYGSFEPMPFTFAETGRAHLLEDWGREAWHYFWRGTAPYQWCFHHAPFVTDARPPTEIERYEWCSMSLEVSPRILKTKKDKAEMLALFAALSDGLDIVYAEIIGETERGPSYKGHGLPDRAALACMIGPDYAAHWPEFVDGATAVGQHFLRDSIIGTDAMPIPPEALHAPRQPDPLSPGPRVQRGVAAVFPFAPLS